MHSVECTPGGSLLCPCIAMVNGKEDVTALSDRDGAAAWPWISLNTERLPKGHHSGLSTGLPGWLLARLPGPKATTI